MKRFIVIGLFVFSFMAKVDAKKDEVFRQSPICKFVSGRLLHWLDAMRAKDTAAFDASMHEAAEVLYTP